MKTRPVRWFNLSRWTFRSTVMPAWLFWVVASAVAVTAGVGVAYFGSPDSGTPLETSVRARDSRVAVTSSFTDRAENDSEESAESAGNGFEPFAGTSIQVLNASSDEGAAAAMADRLEAGGFSIQLVETARRIYQRTTVFWTPNEGRAAALALARHFGWRSAPAPASLTEDLPVHVVVGEDEI